MDIVELFWRSLLIAVLFLSGVFVLAYINKQRYDLIDSAWGMAFIVVALYAYLLAPVKTLVGTIVLAMVLIWGLRLSGHIFARWSRSSSEDPRYEALRENWPGKARVLQMYVRVYLVQALLACVVSLPVLVVMLYQPLVSWWSVAGIAVWLVGFVFEAIGDRQLQQFLRTNRKKNALLTTGLWKYSRHPNYFGEVMQWWGITIMGFGFAYSWVGVIGALTITVLICFVSGIPPAERRASLKPGWAAYKKATSALIPLPTRR